MGKVQIIEKSRKEYKCKKCGKVIPAGSKYYRGEINFGPTIVRCQDCKLQAWEVTTSDYQLAVGQIVYKWRDDYNLEEGVNDDIASALQEVCDDVQDRLDNMPEGLQEGDVGQLLQERIDTLESAISDLESLYVDNFREDVVSEYVDNYLSAEEIAELEGKLGDEDIDWDAVITFKGQEAEDAMNAMLYEAVGDDIDSILGELDV